MGEAGDGVRGEEEGGELSQTSPSINGRWDISGSGGGRALPVVVEGEAMTGGAVERRGRRERRRSRAIPLSFPPCRPSPSFMAPMAGADCATVDWTAVEVSPPPSPQQSSAVSVASLGPSGKKGRAQLSPPMTERSPDGSPPSRRRDKGGGGRGRRGGAREAERPGPLT